MNSRFNIQNSRFQVHEFTILTSWILKFNFMNSRFQLHEFTITTSEIHKFDFLRFQIIKFEKLKMVTHLFYVDNKTQNMQKPWQNNIQLISIYIMLKSLTILRPILTKNKKKLVGSDSLNIQKMLVRAILHLHHAIAFF
jgi:predicted XRE-type DNA-binding protein